MPADAREQLAAGALALLPTDTVYGIACAAADADACRRLYELKQRPQTQATAIMLGSVPGLLAAVPELPQRQAELCRELLPGTLTLLVSNPAGRFAHVCGDDPTRIGVRVPGLLDEVAVLADAAGGLLITSANQRGDPDPAELAEVPASFRERHMSPLDALYAFEDLRARMLIPIHHGAFPLSYERLDEPARWLVELAKSRGVRDHVMLMAAGQTERFVC